MERAERIWWDGFIHNDHVRFCCEHEAFVCRFDFAVRRRNARFRFHKKFIDRTYLSFKTTIISAAFLVSIQMCALKSFKSDERFF